MSRHVLIMVLLAAAFATGVIWLFDLDFSSGQAYPQYSSLRSDTDGTKALHDSLARLDTIEVARGYRPLGESREHDAAILVLGLNVDLSSDRAAELERLARRGNRVVAALHADPEGKPLVSSSLARRWDLTPRRDLYELPFGKGMLVVAPDASLFSNGGLAFAPNPDTISRSLGNKRRIVFDESHLGLTESGSVMALARRYRLEAFAVALAGCVGLFLWRSMSPFPPLAATSEPGEIAGRTSASGLLALIERNIPPSMLASTAWTLWLKGNPAQVSAGRRARAEAAIRRAGDPLEAFQKIQSALKERSQ
jgi:hypothetical protein